MADSSPDPLSAVNYSRLLANVSHTNIENWRLQQLLQWQQWWAWTTGVASLVCLKLRCSTTAVYWLGILLFLSTRHFVKNWTSWSANLLSHYRGVISCIHISPFDVQGHYGVWCVVMFWSFVKIPPVFLFPFLLAHSTLSSTSDGILQTVRRVLGTLLCISRIWLSKLVHCVCFRYIGWLDECRTVDITLQGLAQVVKRFAYDYEVFQLLRWRNGVKSNAAMVKLCSVSS